MRSSWFNAVLSVIVSAMLVSAGAQSLCAQDSGTDEFMLEEITVTAQKRSENQQKVAIAMEVITGSEFAATGTRNIDDILSTVANNIIVKSTDGMRVSLRGLAETEGTFHDLHASTPTVAINIDGAYNSSSSAGQNLFDVERVEVLYGPQSTLYASNSPGGIVNVVTASPKLDRYEGRGSIEFGNYSTINSQVALNVPIVNDIFGLRLAAQQSKRDTFIEGSDEEGEDTKKVRLKALYQANEDLSVTTTFNWSESANGGMMGGQARLFDYQNGHYASYDEATGQYTLEGKVTNPWTAPESASADDDYSRFGPNAADSTTKGITGEIAWSTGIGDVSFVPQYNETSSDDSGNYISSNDDLIYTTFTEMASVQKGAEVRMTSSEDFPFKWILGATYYKSTNERSTTYTEESAEDGSVKNSETNKALFANITYPLTDTFRGTAGVRMSWDKMSNIELPARPGFTGISGQEYNNPDYKIGIEYDLTESSMLYADVSTSYKVNAMNVQEDKVIDPEELMAYTLGAKNRFFGNRLQLNAAAYYYDYKNKTVNLGNSMIFDEIEESELTHDGVPVGDANGDGEIGTASMLADPYQQYGAFRIFGVDVSSDWVITSKDKVSISLSYMSTEWYDLQSDYYYDYFADQEHDYSGAENALSPTWTFNTSYEHTFELGYFGTLVPHVDLMYKSDYLLVLDYDGSNYPFNYQEAYCIVNASATYTSASGMWSVNAYVKNVADYAAKTFWMQDAGEITLGLSDPRTYGAVFSVKF